MCSLNLRMLSYLEVNNKILVCQSYIQGDLNNTIQRAFFQLLALEAYVQLEKISNIEESFRYIYIFFCYGGHLNFIFYAIKFSNSKNSNYKNVIKFLKKKNNNNLESI